MRSEIMLLEVSEGWKEEDCNVPKELRLVLLLILTYYCILTRQIS